MNTGPKILIGCAAAALVMIGVAAANGTDEHPTSTVVDSHHPEGTKTDAHDVPQGKHAIKLEAKIGQRSTVQYIIGLDTHSEVVPAGKTWKFSTRSDDDSVLLTVSPVSSDIEGAPVTCKITVDGKVRSELENPLMAVCSS